MSKEAKDAPEQTPHIGRFTSTPASGQSAMHTLAAAFVKDGFTVIVVTHDGKEAPPACIPANPSELPVILGETMLLEMDQLRECKVIVCIDAQPLFHEGKAYHPIKADVVSRLIEYMQKTYPDDDVSAIYVQE